MGVEEMVQQLKALALEGDPGSPSTPMCQLNTFAPHVGAGSNARAASSLNAESFLWKPLPLHCIFINGSSHLHGL